MTVTTEDEYTAGTGPEDFLSADEPPDVDAGDGDVEAPYGWTRDRQTGELRPKLRPGRPPKPPTPDELRAAEPPPQPEPDQAPDDRPPRRPVSDEDVPMPKGGTIAKGVNRLYRRVGKVVRAMDHDIGAAIVECTLPDPGDPDFVTVGQAWENLAADSPRVRRWLLKLIKGGAVQDLLLAHLPIVMAIVMKPVITRLITKLGLVRLVGAWFERDSEDGETGEGGAGIPDGLTEEDARAMATQMGLDMDEMARRAAAHVASHGTPMAGPEVPPGLRRQQPRNRSRAARRK